MPSAQPAPVPPPPHLAVVGRGLITPDGKLGEVDAALARLLGRAAADIAGLPAHQALAGLLPPADPAIRRALGGEAVLDSELRDERGARWLLSLYPVRSRVGLTLGADLELRPWAVPAGRQALTTDAEVAGLRDELASSDEPFRTIFEQASVGMILVGPQGGLLRVNAGFCTIVGYSPEELRALSLEDLTHPDDLAADREQVRLLLAGEHPPPIEKRYRHRDGHDIWARVTRSLVTDQRGELRFGLVVAQDISAEKAMREALRHSEDLMRRIWERAVFGVLLGSRDGTVTYANPALGQMLGYSIEELCSGKIRWQDLTPPEYQDRDAAASVELTTIGSTGPYEKMFRARDGRLVPVLIGASLIDRGADGGRVGAAFITDLTALKTAEAERARLLAAAEQARAAAEESAARAVALLSLTAALSRALTPARVAEAVIDEACGIFGAAAGAVALLDSGGGELQLLGYQGFPEEVMEPWRRFPLTNATPISDATRRGEPVFVGSLEERDRRYPQLARAQPGSSAQAWVALPLKLDQQVIGAVGFTFATPRSFDDDERTYLMTVAGLCAQALERARLSDAERAALDAADEALAMLDMVVDSAPVGMAYVDDEFRYRRVNPRLAAMNGLPAADHIGRRARDLFPAGAAIWEPHWRKVLDTGEPVTGLVLTATMDDGQCRHAQVSFYPVRVGDGPVLGVGVLVTDITEQREAEEERARLLASEQAARAAAQDAQARAEAALELRDTFLSVAAHELKTPLTSLLGQAQLLERRLESAGLLTEQNARSLQVVVGQSRRLNHLISDLLDGAQLELGQLIIKRRPAELGRMAQQIVEELQPTVPGHSFRVELPEGPTNVLVDPVRMEQVIQNLLSNAVKYSPRGSEVRVELRREGGRALLAIHDRGVGIAPDALPRVFERFFRAPSPATASVSGVGVGLYVVREIVRLHEGDVRVTTALGEGSTFTVDLPLAEA
jgi:PAS domain S-box-containing protein